MATCELYPGAVREFAEFGEAYSVFDEKDLECLAGFGLEKYATDPSRVDAFVGELTADRAFPGIVHHGNTRAFLLNGEDGSRCVVKPFPEYYSATSGLQHMATQELLHEAFLGTEGYDAARVYAHIGLSKKSGAGFAIMEYVDAYTYRQIEGPVDHTNLITKAVTRAVVAVRHRTTREAMLPQGTTLATYTELKKNAPAARDEALTKMGFSIPAHVERGKYAGCTNWDYNPDNLLCSVDRNGAPTLTVIDQGADLADLMQVPL